MTRLSVSRVLSEHKELCASHLSSPTVADRVKRCRNGRPDGTPAIIREDGLLAADRVCLAMVSPSLPVGSYPRNQRLRVKLLSWQAETLVSPLLTLRRAVSFLWHFP